MRGKGLPAYVALVLLLGISAAGYAAEPIKLKFANYFPVQHKNTALGQLFCDEIKKRTGGRVEISYYPGGTLLTAPKMAAGVSVAISDIGLSHCAYSRGRFPVMEMMELPLGSPSAYVSTHVANDFYDRFKPKEWNDYYPLMFSTSPPAVLQTIAKPVRTLEEMKGLKIRATGRIGDLVKDLGATPMPVEMVDLYEALRRRVIDGNIGDVVFGSAYCWRVSVRGNPAGFAHANALTTRVAAQRHYKDTPAPQIPPETLNGNVKTTGLFKTAMFL